MLLAEAIREKEYIEKAITRLQLFIGMSCVSVNRYNIDAKLRELDELYKKHQQLSVKIDRAKATSVIKIGNTDFSISDAIIIKETMEKKLADYEKLLKDVALFNDRQPSNPIDLDFVYKSMETTAVDVKHLDNAINGAMWQIEA